MNRAWFSILLPATSSRDLRKYATPYSTFCFTEEQVLMRDSVLGLMARLLPPDKIAELDRQQQFPREAYQALAENGWLTLPYDKAHGGMDASHKDLAVFIEA